MRSFSDDYRDTDVERDSRAVLDAAAEPHSADDILRDEPEQRLRNGYPSAGQRPRLRPL